MAFYELTATSLQNAPNVYNQEWDVYTIFWNNTISDNVFCKYCAMIESTIDDTIYQYVIGSGYNTVNNYSDMLSRIKANNYFDNTTVKIKVCANNDPNTTWNDLIEYTKALQGQNFTYYKTPTLSCDIDLADIVTVNQQINFTYNSSKTTEYVKIKLYYYDTLTRKQTDLVDEYVQSNIPSGQITITPNFTLQDYKNYSFIFEVKEVNGSFGNTNYYPFYFFTGETQFYNNIGITKSTRYFYSLYDNLELDSYIELELDNPNSEDIDYYIGILKDGDSYSNHEENIGYYVRKEIQNDTTRFHILGNEEPTQYYNVLNQQYDIGIFGATQGRYITDEVIYQKISNTQTLSSIAFFTFNINSEIGLNNYTIKRLLLDNNNKYKFHADFSVNSNSLIDYAEFSLYNSDLGIIATSPKIYNDRTDTDNLSLSYEFDFTNLDKNIRYNLIVTMTTIYGGCIKNHYYAFNTFILDKFINNINIKKVEYINGNTTYTYRVYIDCEEYMATIGLVLNTTDSSSYLTYQRRQDPHQYIDFVVNKSNTTFTQQNTPYFLQIGAKENGTMYNSDFDIIKQNYEKTVVYYLLPPSLSININEGDIITNSNYTFLVDYYNTEEPIDYAIFYLYDENNNLINQSEKLFNPNDPPLIVYKYFGGFLNDTSYKIKAYVKTFHGLEVETDLINFNIEYESPILYAPFKLENKCNDGYIKVESDIFIGEGESNPSPMIYIDEGEKYSAYAIKSDPVIQYGRDTSSWIYWENGVDINTDFVIKFWFNVGTVNNDILRLYNDNGNYINIKFKRLNRSIYELNGDYIEVSTSENVIANSNILHSRTNGTNKYFLWIKVVNNQWEVILQEVSKEDTVFNWNDSDNNLQWNMSTDLELYGEEYEDNDLQSPLYNFNPNNFNKILVGNAICRELEISNNIDLEYSDEVDDWDEYMVLKCDFDENIRGGNLNEQLGNIDAIRIKRMDETNNTWITLYEKEILSEEDLIVEYDDYIVPKGVEQTYAIVPLLSNGDEGNYLVDKITPNWNYCFVSDGEQCFKLYSSINYSSVDRNKPVGTLNPMGSVYPFIIRNSDNNYNSGVLSGQLMGYNYEDTRILDRVDVVKQTQDYINFLINGKSKVITDWNGNCWIVQVVSNPKVNYNVATTNGINTVSFSWVEQGKYNNEEDLINNNLI